MYSAEGIIYIVATESITDHIRRQVKMMQDMYSCKRRNSENPAVFARRFEGMTFKYVNYGDGTNVTDEDRGFAMFLLENANISTSVYNTIITQLASKGQARTLDSSNAVMKLNRNTVEKVRTRLTTVSENYKVCKTPREPTLPEDNADLVLSGIREIGKSVRHIYIFNGRKQEDVSTAPIILEDALEALSHTKASDVKETAKSIPTARTMMGHKLRISQANNRPENRFNQTLKPTAKLRKLQSNSRACGKRGHWWKDPICKRDQNRQPKPDAMNDLAQPVREDRPPSPQPSNTSENRKNKDASRFFQ